jgi:hypothetical protein
MVLDASGKAASGVTVAFEGGRKQTTDATGRALFFPPEGRRELRASLEDGSASAASALIVAPLERTELRIDAVQRMLQLHDVFTVSGCCFSGEADSNRILLGGAPAAILAASPVALVAAPAPRTPLGATQLTLESGGGTVTTAPITVIALEVTAMKQKGSPGEAGELRIKVRGTLAALEFQVLARPEGRIEFSSGNVFRGQTQGGADNSAAVPYTFRAPGDYAVEVRLMPQSRE